MHSSSSSRFTPREAASMISVLGAVVVLVGFVLPWTVPQPCVHPHMDCTHFTLNGLLLLLILPTLPLTHNQHLDWNIWLDAFLPFLVAICGIASLVLGILGSDPARGRWANVAQIAAALVGLATVTALANVLISNGHYPAWYADLGLGLYLVAGGFVLALAGGGYAHRAWHAPIS